MKIVGESDILKLLCISKACDVREIFYILRLKYNHPFVKQLNELNLKVEFEDGLWTMRDIQKGYALMAQGHGEDGLY